MGEAEVFRALMAGLLLFQAAGSIANRLAIKRARRSTLRLAGGRASGPAR